MIPFVAYVASSVFAAFLYFYDVVSIKTNTAISSVILFAITYLLLRKQWLSRKVLLTIRGFPSE